MYRTLEVWYRRGIATHYTSQSTFLSGPLGGVSAPTPSSENSKTRTASTALTIFVAYRPVALNKRRGHRMMHCKHSPNISLKISLTDVVGLYTAVMDTPTSMGCILFPSKRSPTSNTVTTASPTRSFSLSYSTTIWSFVNCKTLVFNNLSKFGDPFPNLLVLNFPFSLWVYFPLHASTRARPSDVNDVRRGVPSIILYPVQKYIDINVQINLDNESQNKVLHHHQCTMCQNIQIKKP